MSISKNNKYNVIVVGSGLGGLSCALHFAKQGFHVLVLEKQPKVGGYCQNYLRGDYNFDVSLHILSAMNKTGGLYKLLNYLQVVDKLSIVEHRPMFASVFPDKTYALPAGEEAAAIYLKKHFPNEKNGIDKFIKTMKSIVTDNTNLFWSKQIDFSNFFPARYFKKTYDDLLNECFTNKKLHGLLGQLWQSTGLPNNICAANWAAEVFGTHLLSGNYYIKGGGQSLSVAMADTLREAGSVVNVSSLVSKILIKDKEAYGVALENGQEFFAPIIISNANPIQTYFSLIGKEKLSKAYIYKLNNMKQSCSLITLYLGINCKAKEVGIDHRSVFVNHSYDNAIAYDLAMNEKFEKTDYLISDYTEEDTINHPDGHGIIQILEIADGQLWTQIDREQYEKKKAKVTSTILNKVYKRYPKLKDCIQVCEIGTPRTMALATRNPNGAVYGWAQTPEQADNWRFGVASIFEGLYFAGAWSRGGGGGYMGAIINGRVAFQTAMERSQLSGKETHINVFKTSDSSENKKSQQFLKTTQKEDSSNNYSFIIEKNDISAVNELLSEVCVKWLSKSANNYIKSQFGNNFETSFFQMRFVFVPFVKIEVGDIVSIDVEFTQKESGKGEFNQNVYLVKNEKRLANSGGRVLIRER